MAHDSERCTLLLFEGQDSAALNCSLNARFGLEGAPFYLTLAGTGPDSAIVPLTAALPAGTSLVLHVREVQERRRSSRASSGGDSTQAFRLRVPSGRAGSLDPPDADLLSERAKPLLEPSSSSLHNGAFSVDMDRPDGERLPHERGECQSLETQMTQLSAASRHHQQAAAAAVSIVEAVQDVDRMQRLTLDLANERTLLAWTRTSLAAMRTVFPFLAMDGEGMLAIGLIFSRCGMVFLCLLAGFFGTVRFFQVKRVTFAPVTGAVRFGRCSMHWFTSFLGVACAVMAACTISAALS